MLSSLAGFVKRRQRGLAILGSAAGGIYLAASYARSRFAELSERLVTDRAAKENLRRRFQQAQEDCAFTLLALLPTLSKQVLEELDVEALTAELQRRAEETRKAKEAPRLLEQSTTSALGQSWDTLGNSALYPAETREAAQVALPDEGEDEREYLGANGESQHMNGSAAQVEAAPETPADPRTKAELWQAVKILTFQRTITSLYLLCLLAVQTHIQLNLLGRFNYVNSVYEQAWRSATAANGQNGLFDDEALARRLKAELTGEKAEDVDDDDAAGKRIDGHTEQQYLSCTWWLLWKGWRDISERVRIATEESLESVSLKTQLGADDLRKLLVEIRRKIEYEPTGACHSFAAATFPMSHAAESETLEKSGLGDTFIGPDFRGLLDETKDFLESPDSSVVLRSCLDRTFSQLSSSLAHLFVDDSQPPSQMRFEELQDKKVRLAAVLPALARASHSILNTMPNEFAEALADNRELQEFSAVVYSNFLVEQ